MRLIGFFLTMNEFSDLVGQNLLSFIDFLSLKLSHLIDFLHRQKGQELEAFNNVSIINISPVLIEIVGAGLFRIQPDCSSLRLTHFFTVMGGEQRKGHTIGFLSLHAANKVNPA